MTLWEYKWDTFFCKKAMRNCWKCNKQKNRLTCEINCIQCQKCVRYSLLISQSDLWSQNPAIPMFFLHMFYFIKWNLQYDYFNGSHSHVANSMYDKIEYAKKDPIIIYNVFASSLYLCYYYPNFFVRIFCLIISLQCEMLKFRVPC